MASYSSWVKLGSSPEKSVSKLFSGLSGEQQRKVKNILADKEQTERILSSPQARELLKKLMGGKEK